MEDRVVLGIPHAIDWNLESEEGGHSLFFVTVLLLEQIRDNTLDQEMQGVEALLHVADVLADVLDKGAAHALVSPAEVKYDLFNRIGLHVRAIRRVFQEFFQKVSRVEI